MTDDNTATGGAVLSHINVTVDGELRDWAKRLDATPEQIREAVKAVGNRAADVEMHLKGTHATTNADQEARGEAVDKAR
jgi:lipoate-protein ligase A